MVLKKLGDQKTGILSLSIVQYILSKSEYNYFEVYDIKWPESIKSRILEFKVIHKMGYILMASSLGRRDIM